MINDGVFGAGDDKDPIVGTPADQGGFTVPRKPVRKRLHGIPQFVVTRGGEYCFMPGLRALRWLSDLQTKCADERRAAFRVIHFVWLVAVCGFVLVGPGGGAE